jgi:hypothetical protein
MVSCLGPGVVTQISSDPNPDPTPTPVSTSTAWYIQNVFSGDWNYQFYEGEVAVQTYKVKHSVFNNGEIRMQFVDLQTGFINFNADGAIDMNTGDFFAQGYMASIGAIDGNVELRGTFATDTIVDYSIDQMDFFSASNTAHRVYTVKSIRYAH